MNLNLKILNDESFKEKWNSLNEHPIQSWEWGDIKKKSGNELIRLGFFDDQDNLVERYLITLHKIPVLGKKIGNVSMSRIPSDSALEQICRFALDLELIFIKFEPFVYLNEEVERDYDYFFNNPNLIKSPTPLFYKWTSVIDLLIDQDENSLMNQIEKKCRYSIRQAEKKNVIVKIDDTEKGFEIFYDLYSQTVKKQKYFGHNHSYHKNIWENLHGKYSTILIAYFDDKPIAATELFFMGENVFYAYAGSNEEYRNLMANNLLLWEAMKYGRKIGAKKFDLWGISDPSDSKEEWMGFTKFKQSFGGQDTQMVGSWDLVINKSFYMIYNFMYKLRKTYFEFRKKL